MLNTNYSLTKNLLPVVQHLTQAGPQLCHTMASRGEIVKKVIQESGFSITSVAEKIRISRAQLYNDFSNPDMSLDRILAIGKVLSHDFSQDLKELSPELVSMVNEEPVPYAAALNECRERLIETQTKLIESQTQFISTMSELSQYKRKYGELGSS